MKLWKTSRTRHPHTKAATPELHSSSRGLAVRPRSTHTAALRRAGERTAVGAPPPREGRVEIALPGTARFPPPPAISLRRCPLFLSSNSNCIKLSNLFFATRLETWTRDEKGACVNSKHNNTGSNHGGVEPSPLPSAALSPCAESATRQRGPALPLSAATRMRKRQQALSPSAK